MKTKQEVFDFVLAAIRKQGRASMQNSRCRYRGDNGAKCAAGHLIPGDRYNPENEGRRISDCTTMLAPDVRDHWPFIQSLQNCHDSAARFSNANQVFMRHFEMDMETLASNQNLTYTAPEASHA